MVRHAFVGWKGTLDEALRKSSWAAGVKNTGLMIQ